MMLQNLYVPMPVPLMNSKAGLDGLLPLLHRGLDGNNFQKQFEMWIHHTTTHFSNVGQSIAMYCVHRLWFLEVFLSPSCNIH